MKKRSLLLAVADQMVNRKLFKQTLSVFFLVTITLSAFPQQYQALTGNR
jgi:hypothetical protein